VLVVVDEVVPELVVAEETLVSEEALVSVEPPLASKQPCNDTATKPAHSNFFILSFLIFLLISGHLCACPDCFKTNQWCDYDE